MLKLIPQPQSFVIKKGGMKYSSLIFSMPDFPQSLADDFRRFLAKASVSFAFSDSNANVCVQRCCGMPLEAYQINIGEVVTITASHENGVFYALQTLKQIVLQSPGTLPALEICDEPKYEYRGFMLDVGRYFYPVEQVKQFLDMMALHKLNWFHFHLTEDQGWRIEIKKYPLLTEKGSRRSHTNFNRIPHGGFYTQSDIREIVAYAHSLYIKVMPEIDVPGHIVSAMACYPELSCFNRKLSVKTHWGVKHDVLCVGKNSTYQFLYDVFDEVCDLFPDGYVHIGGDEVVKLRWAQCPHCQRAISENSLNGTEELQQFFMSKIAAYLEAKGVKAFMWNWDSIEPTKHLSKSIGWTLCGYDDKTVGTVAAELASGRKMINTKTRPYYLDMPYGWVNLKMVCEQNPEAFIKNGGAESFLGIEAPLWTEYVPNMKKANYMTYPRLGAISQTAWCGLQPGAYEDFLAKLPFYYKLLDCCGVTYATLKQCMPSKPRAFFSSAWFNRRELHWEGLHNLIDDIYVKIKY